MHLKVVRNPSADESTIGTMLMNGQFKCFTIEDEIRAPGVKVYGKTAIPNGTYKVIIDLSSRFGVLMPRLLDVPGFAGIRIHSGNTSLDTHGCILVGTRIAEKTKKNPLPMITGSRMAYEILFGDINRALESGEDVYIEIENPA